MTMNKNILAIRNHTPHAITITDTERPDDRSRWYTIPAEPESARVAQRNEDMGGFLTDDNGLSFAIARPSYGEVTGLPAPQEGIMYLVSSIVADALRGSGRTDILVPDSGPDAVRENGVIVAVRRVLYRGA